MLHYTVIFSQEVRVTPSTNSVEECWPWKRDGKNIGDERQLEKSSMLIARIGITDAPSDLNAPIINHSCWLCGVLVVAPFRGSHVCFGNLFARHRVWIVEGHHSRVWP